MSQLRQIGDQVEVLVDSKRGLAITLPPSERQDYHIWVTSTIVSVNGDDDRPYRVVNEYNSNGYWPDLRIIRAPASPLYSNCVECGMAFIYPVEANCSQGRVCYSCRQSYGWKYQIFKESA